MEKLNQAQIAALFRAYHSAKVMADKAKSIGDEIKSLLRALDKDTYEAGGFLAKVSVVNTKRFDQKRFEADYPELYKQYLTSISVERLNFK